MNSTRIIILSLILVFHVNEASLCRGEPVYSSNLRDVPCQACHEPSSSNQSKKSSTIRDAVFTGQVCTEDVVQTVIVRVSQREHSGAINHSGVLTYVGKNIASVSLSGELIRGTSTSAPLILRLATALGEEGIDFYLDRGKDLLSYDVIKCTYYDVLGECTTQFRKVKDFSNYQQNAAPETEQDDDDWLTVERNIRFVSFEKTESKRGALHLSTINGRYAAEMDIDKYWHWVEESDRPGYKYMTNFGSDFFTSLWYFNSHVIGSLPPKDGMVFVALVKAVSDDGRYGHFRVYRHEASREMTIIFPDNPVFGRMVFESGRSDYPYYFTSSGYTWYFKL